jgi:hypothetical protein
MRQLKLATTPDGRMLGGPDRADGDPVEINLASAIYGPPDEIARKIEALREAGAGYLLMNGGGSGGGERGRQSLRRFAREVMPRSPRSSNELSRPGAFPPWLPVARDLPNSDWYRY